MNHTPQIKKAIQFAAKKHHGQLRHDKEPLPYVTHLFSVAILVAEDGAHDDVVTAALLHDVIEDTATTRDEVVAAFNEHVALLVESVSENKTISEWRARKEDYLTRVEAAEDDTIVIAMADKVDNIESKIEGFEQDGPDYLKKFGRPTSDYLWFHGEALRIAEKRIPNHPLTKRLAEAHAREQKAFGAK